MGEKHYFIGVDVGTKSTRAALVSESGQIMSVAVQKITVSNPKPDFYEQSSDEIWKAVCSCVKEVSENVDKSLVKGIGFDATCSMVVLDKDFSPVSLESSSNGIYNIVMWMDHRAKEEAAFINSGSYECLKYVGGSMSIEMQVPKLLWLKNNAPTVWKSAEHFFGLPDFLTFKASGKLSRSQCSLVCKWAYLCDRNSRRWDSDFLRKIGLQELLHNNCSKLGETVLTPGSFLGELTESAATELGLFQSTAVGTSIIDAHAGTLALLFAGLREEETERGDGSIANRLGLISGTSTCHMCISPEPIFVQGVWGPYFGGVLADMWLCEGGQSAAGSLIDHIVLNHSAVKFCPKERDIYGWLEDVLEKMSEKAGLADITFLTQDLHLYPDFHGNRAPLADPTFKGMICGLSLDCGVESLALLYLATLQALAYGTKDIVEQLEKSGFTINTVLMCGGLTQSRIFLLINADVLERPVLIPQTRESVLLGAAMLGASASGIHGNRGDLKTIAFAMAGKADALHPRTEFKEFHERKYKVFKKMQSDQIFYREIMKSAI